MLTSTPELKKQPGCRVLGVSSYLVLGCIADPRTNTGCELVAEQHKSSPKMGRDGSALIWLAMLRRIRRSVSVKATYEGVVRLPPLGSIRCLGERGHVEKRGPWLAVGVEARDKHSTWH